MEVKVVLIGTLDSKVKEIEFLRGCLEQNNAEVILIDVSSKEALNAPNAHHFCKEVAQEGGTVFREVAELSKTEAAVIMAKGASRILSRLIEEDKVDAVIAIGGGSGTNLGCEILRTLPRGLPKVMISAVAASDMTWHLGTKDIVVVNAVVDICMNRILRQVLINTAYAVVGMARGQREGRVVIPSEQEKPLVAATMYGVTQPCVFAARELLQAGGYEVVIFSAGAMGPTAMEELVLDGAIDLVLDVTTTSLIDDVAGGQRSSGSTRLTAAGRMGIPQVIAPGAVDMINFGPLHAIPNEFRSRFFYRHSSTTTLMRATGEELVRLAHLMAERLNKSDGPVTFLVPQKGFSKYDREKGPNAITYDGQPAGRLWHDPEANSAFIHTLQSVLDTSRIELSVIDAHINDPLFAEELVSALYKLQHLS